MCVADARPARRLSLAMVPVSGTSASPDPAGPGSTTVLSSGSCTVQWIVELQMKVKVKQSFA